MTRALACAVIAFQIALTIPACADPADPPRLNGIDTPFWTQKAPAIVGIRAAHSDGTYTGTGFWISDRFIVTARHLVTPYSAEPCVRDGDKAPTEVSTVFIYSGRPSDIRRPDLAISVKDHPKLITPITDSDIAIVDVEPQSPKPTTLFADVYPTLTQGATLHVYGFPQGDPPVPLRGQVANPATKFVNFSSMTFTLQEGYSGGPIADDKGDVIGVDSCGKDGYEYISLLVAASSFLQDHGVTVRGNTFDLPKRQKTLIVAGVVYIYDTGNGSTSPPRPAHNGEVFITVRNIQDQAVVGESWTNNDQGDFSVVTNLTINDAPSALLISLTQRDDYNAVSTGEARRYISNPIQIDVDATAEKQTLTSRATIWERSRYVINTLLQAKQLADEVVKSLPTCLRNPESQRRVACIDANPHLLDPRKDQIESVQKTYIDAISKIPQEERNKIATQSLSLGNFLDTIGDPCGAVLLTQAPLSYRDLDPSLSYAGPFVTWVTSCASSPSSVRTFGLSTSQKDSGAIWGLGTLADVLGYMPGLKNADGNTRTILSDFLSLFESLQEPSGAGPRQSSAEKILSSPRLLGIFRYFIDTWANPLCHGRHNPDSITQIEEAMRNLRVLLSANKCQFSPETYVAKPLAPIYPTEPRWELVRVDDCSGRDEDNPTNGEVPAKENCASSAVTAVCWDGRRFRNGLGPWCTYKSIGPSSCTGGSAPGRLYRCVPGSEVLFERRGN